MTEPSGRPVPPRRNLFLSILMVVAGIVLLLPGLCALVFSVFALSGGGGDSGLLGLWLLCFAVSAGGIALIVFAFRR
ncbi:MAG TPA: hypothetical protein VG986_04115 [Pseudolabrys sp.]|nr:hypothetical protein [Pseudolabrys sp.]